MTSIPPFPFQKLLFYFIFASSLLAACHSTKQAFPQENTPFFDQRKKSLSITPKDLGLHIPDSQTVVYGIILDWYLGNGVAYISAYENGNASMFISTGGGRAGDASNPNLKATVDTYLQKGQAAFSKAFPTTATPLPDKKSIRFYFLTNKGTYFIEEKLEKLDKETSEFLPLFLDANKVMAVLKAGNR